MKRLLFIASLLLLPLAPARAELIDSIAAKVDQEIILVSEIIGSIEGQPEIIRETAIDQADYERKISTLMFDTLNEIIESKILYREALRGSVVVEDSDVEKEIDRVRNGYETTEEFMAYLNETGLTLSDYRARSRKSMMARIMSGRKIRELEQTVVVNEEDVVKFFEENRDDFSKPERVYVRQIMLPARPNTPEREEAIAKLEILRDEILAGADFKELARNHSKAAGADDGGIIGWNARGDLVPVLEEAVFALESGGISEVVEAQFGVHLLKVDEREAERDVVLADVRSLIEPSLRRKEATERYQKWINDLRKRSNIRVYL